MFKILTFPHDDLGAGSVGAGSPISSSSASPQEQFLQAFLFPVVPHTTTDVNMLLIIDSPTSALLLPLPRDYKAMRGSWPPISGVARSVEAPLQFRLCRRHLASCIMRHPVLTYQLHSSSSPHSMDNLSEDLLEFFSGIRSCHVLFPTESTKPHHCHYIWISKRFIPPSPPNIVRRTRIFNKESLFLFVTPRDGPRL